MCYTNVFPLFLRNRAFYCSTASCAVQGSTPNGHATRRSRRAARLEPPSPARPGDTSCSPTGCRGHIRWPDLGGHSSGSGPCCVNRRGSPRAASAGQPAGLPDRAQQAAIDDFAAPSRSRQRGHAIVSPPRLHPSAGCEPAHIPTSIAVRGCECTHNHDQIDAETLRRLDLSQSAFAAALALGGRSLTSSTSGKGTTYPSASSAYVW